MKIAPTYFFVLLLGLALTAAPSLPTAAPDEVGLSAERLQRIDQMIERRIAAGEMTGAVAIVARHGKIAHYAAAGVMDLDSKKPMSRETIFRIASMTKPVVGLAIMMLVEEGKVRITDPVSRYIPEFREMKVAMPMPRARGGGGAPAFYTMPAERQITIKDLLTHVSGLSSGPMSNAATQGLNRRPEENLASYVPRLGATPLEFQPGARWSYSSQSGFDTLGRIVEIASGLQLDRFLRQRVFDPLGMQDITFWPSEAQWPRVATPYSRSENGLQKTANPNFMSSAVYFMGAGGLMATAQDYLPFPAMLANGGELGGKRLLSPKTVEMMRAVHAPDTLPGRPAGEGFGLSMRVVSNHAARGTLLSDGSFGWSGYYGTHFFIDPVEDLVGVWMVQTSNDEVNRDFETLVMQSVVKLNQ